MADPISGMEILRQGFNLIEQQIEESQGRKMASGERAVYENSTSPRQLAFEVGMSNYEAERNWQYQKKAAELNQKFLEDYYNKFESPSAKLRQYREAGMNPYSAVGSESAFPVQSAASLQAPTVSYSQPLANLAQRQLQTRQLSQERFLRSFDIAASMATTFANLQSTSEDVRAKKIANDREEWVNSVWSSPISEEWSRLVPGMDALFSAQPISGPNLSSNGTTGLSFGQALQMAQAFETLKNINEKGAGYYSNDPQTPWANYLRSVASSMTKHGRDWSQFRSNDFIGELYQPWRAAFDVVHGSNLSGISQSDYQRWYNDWSKELRRKGLNPEGNDLLNTALRVIHQTTPKSDFDYMMQSLGKGLGIAANGVGDIFSLLDRLLKPSDEYLRARDKYMKYRKK